MGNLTQEVIGGQSSSTSTFAYDDLYRLTSATVNGTSYSYVYDQVGNRTSQTVGGVTTTYTVDSADHLTAVNGAAVTSDPDGNVTSDGAGGLYTWDVRGRLVGLTKNGSSYSFQYGPDNLRVSKSVNGVLTSYLLDGNQVVTDTINGTANQTLYGPGTDHALARNGEYFLPNHLSSTTGLTDGAGNLTQSYSYGPFGEALTSPTDSNPFQYTGRENDGEGLLYYRARYYCPAWGRFVSSDPAGFGGGINPYVYAGNNPVNNADPSGLYTKGQYFAELDGGEGGGYYGGGGYIGGDWLAPGGMIPVNTIGVGAPLPPSGWLGGLISRVEEWLGLGGGGTAPETEVLLPGPAQPAAPSAAPTYTPHAHGPFAGDDVALGLKGHLGPFAEATGGLRYNQWPGMYTEPFQETFTRMMDQADTIHFNLEGMDMPRAYSYTGNGYPFNLTNWEFQQILNNPKWYGKAQFYNLPAVP